MGIVSTGITGLQVAQLGLLTTEHNITNANTPGFNRQRNVQVSNIAMLTGSGFIGQGSHVSTIERMYDQFLSTQVNRTQTTSSELEAYATQIKQIDNMLADPNAGVSPALQEFFRGVQQVSADPSQLPARQAMVSSAQALVARFQGLDDRISQMYDGLNSQLTTAVASINSYSEQIAQLNESIVNAGSSINQPANDLMDQRDQLILELNKLVRVTTTTNSDGSFNVYVGNGQQLVTGTQVTNLTALPSIADPSRFAIGLQTASGPQELPESLITGGSLGGLLSFRSGSLDRVANDLGRNAASLALTFNAQHALGQDLLGQSIGDVNFAANFFTVSTPTVIANGNNSSVTPGTIAAALVTPPPIDGSYTLGLNGAGTLYTLTRQSDGTAWTGATLAALQAAVPAGEALTLTGAVVAAGASTQVFSPAANGANYYTKLTSSDYRLDYDGTNYSVTRLSDNTQWSNASLATLSTTVAGSEGFSFSLSSGTVASGDSFIIQPARAAAKNIAVNPTVAADVRLIAAAMPIRTAAASANTGAGTISDGKSLHGFGTPAFPAGGVTLTYDSTGNTLTLAGLPAGANVSVTAGNTTTVYPGPVIPYTSTAIVSFAGVSFNISGSLGNGDVFTVGQNTGGVSDGRNALALGQLQTQNTMSGKTASYQTAYAQLVGDAGNKSREIEVKSQAQNALLKQSTDARDSLSGVNLDEEAANLIRYQQAYQASAKMLDIGSKLFDVLLSIRS
ncbi:flagellar hook-associated protein FlgK [Propionivibrio sp.]|uniref:flagellar hook-associated protein FlgK n=1 Tax=Propionivibrio sp. TaxID=2212460 RepID=UPI0025EE037E|nr:flagellar hook-associated protein FlgK [Propionivibrio sp.]MBK7355538.1 flagellar hook-associated protein FlgK [Propionivibrio sp.]MBK8400792.1 flagellar hook-associated protein FlgK [Propionivibrio sp.]MBK8744818.1 flagellar hook-associated protein FlgK [Propionivibrio sp.]MBK8893202.1 flagellar hook-associated protein FlgK [Propionivibrio sp.]MBL0207822.1 flagellar hook-associated protein FlgK [Propionivibrio sp.]